MKKIFMVFSLLLASGAIQKATPATSEFSGYIAAESRIFLKDPLLNAQERDSASVAAKPEYYYEWDSGSSFTFVPFARLDNADKERSHFDIRELNYLYLSQNWEMRIGIGKVFWGATEFVHLADIINQTDLVESITEEDKLGQPMLRLSRIMDDGSLDFFVLPYFRERTFPGIAGRFRSPLVVDTDHPSYESSDKEKHVDYALRLNKTLDDFDVGLSYFDGTSRQPTFRQGLNNGQPVLIPHYPLMQQLGLDLQYTGEEIIWKLEALTRRFDDSRIKDYSAAVGGFEYTIPGVTKGGGDLGLLAEVITLEDLNHDQPVNQNPPEAETENG